MSRLPIVGGDLNAWGSILNSFLSVSLDSAGYLLSTVSTGNIINIKDPRYGAVGDGTTNDTTAIQSGLTALQSTGGALYFPPGTYLINAQRLTYTSLLPICLFGAGWSSKLLWSPATDSPAQNKGMLNIFGTGNADAQHCTGVTIRDLFFDFGAARASGYDSDKRGLNIYNSDNVLISGCQFKGCRGEMVGLGNFGSPVTPGNRAWITSCYFTDFAQDGANPNNFDSTVIGCTFLTGVTPIEAGRDGAAILGNKMEDMTSHMNISSARGFVVSGNRFKNCATTDPGGQLGVIGILGNGPTAPSLDGVISGNSITNDATYANQAGIFFTRGTSTTDNARITVTGNIINGIRSGIFCTSLLDGAITGNQCVGTGAGVGIIVNSGGQCLRTSVHGNSARNFAARSVSPSTNGPIEDASGDTGLNTIGWNTQENTLVMGASGRIDFTNLDTTPSVSRPAGIYYVANTVATIITNFDDATFGQVIHLVFDDANTTINDGGNFLLNGNFVSTAGDSLSLIFQGAGLWVELGRSVN